MPLAGARWNIERYRFLYRFQVYLEAIKLSLLGGAFTSSLFFAPYVTVISNINSATLEVSARIVVIEHQPFSYLDITLLFTVNVKIHKKRG